MTLIDLRYEILSRANIGDIVKFEGRDYLVGITDDARRYLMKIPPIKQAA